MKIAAAMSGGADSAATAIILKAQGHDVLGLHMSVVEPAERWETEWDQAKAVADHIGIPILRLDLRAQFKSTVIRYFIDEYKSGRTPSPCPVCNRDIKMTLLLEAATKEGCAAMATGHYAILEDTPAGPALFRGKDRLKDQSYFLFSLSPKMLEMLRLPMGVKTKRWAREFLKERGVPVWDRDESQDVCFLSGDYRDFLSKSGVPFEPGPVINKEGEIIGRHKGFPGYTIGQRRGLGVCAERPLYVIGIDAASNAVIVGFKEDTLIRDLTIVNFNNLLYRPLEIGEEFMVQVRYRAKPAKAVVREVNGGIVTMEFPDPVSSAPPGQAAVLYEGDRVAGGGWIDQAIPISLLNLSGIMNGK